MAKRKSPGVGRGAGDNSGLADLDDIGDALAQEILDQQAMDLLRERRKKNRKGYEAKGIRLDKLDSLYRRRDSTQAEILEEFRQDAHYAGALHSDLGQQFGLFEPKADEPVVRSSHRHVGLMAGLKGDPDTPPPGLAGDALQQFIDGYNEGAERRNRRMAAAIQEAKDNGQNPSLAFAIAAADRQAKEVAKAPGEPEAEDPLVVDGERYPNKRAANAARARLAERQAEEKADADPAPSTPAGDAPEPGMTYSGPAPRDVCYALSSEEPMPSGRIKSWVNGEAADTVEAGTVPIYDEHPVDANASGDDFEATQEELDAQVGRKKQEAEAPDPAQVEADAKKLQESGFAPLPGEKTKGRGK